MDGATNIEQMEPFVRAIADDFQALANDTEGKFNKYSEDFTKFAEFFRSGLDSCCAAHRFEQIASIQIHLAAVVKICTCGDNLNHMFIKEIINIIGKHMNKCVEDAGIRQMFAERVN